AVHRGGDDLVGLRVGVVAGVGARAGGEQLVTGRIRVHAVGPAAAVVEHLPGAVGLTRLARGEQADDRVEWRRGQVDLDAGLGELRLERLHLLAGHHRAAAVLEREAQPGAGRDVRAAVARPGPGLDA